MKKLIVLSVIIAMTLSVSALAATQKATLINSFGDKVVVAAGSSEAQSFFGQGYVLMGAPLSAPVITNTEKVCDCPEVGATPGSTFVNKAFFKDGYVKGGRTLIATTTMNTAFTLTAAQVCNNKVIKVNTAATATFKAAASLDITMPATSTLFSECLRDNGDEVKFLFVNASPTAASTTEMIAGTGCEAMISGDTGAADLVAGGSSAWITLIRATDYLGVNGTADCQMIIEELVAD